MYRREITDPVKAEIIDRFLLVKGSVGLNQFAKSEGITRPVLSRWLRDEKEIKFRAAAMEHVNLV